MTREEKIRVIVNNWIFHGRSVGPKRHIEGCNFDDLIKSLDKGLGCSTTQDHDQQDVSTGQREVDHEFKSHPDVFWPAARGQKLFEFRRDDRPGGFHVGQTVRIRCWLPLTNAYLDTPPLDRVITNILRGGEFGLQEGYCVLGLKPLDAALANHPLKVGEREGWKLVPVDPTEEMWGGIARQIVIWSRGSRLTGLALHRDLKNSGWPIPDWLGEEIEDADYVPPKGCVAVAIYRAMLAAAPTPTDEGAEILREALLEIRHRTYSGDRGCALAAGAEDEIAALKAAAARDAEVIARTKVWVVTNNERGAERRYRMWSGRAWVWTPDPKQAAQFHRRQDANQILPDGSPYDYEDRIAILTSPENADV